jgi:hypothetical protein
VVFSGDAGLGDEGHAACQCERQEVVIAGKHLVKPVGFPQLDSP